MYLAAERAPGPLTGRLETIARLSVAVAGARAWIEAEARLTQLRLGRAQCGWDQARDSSHRDRVRDRCDTV